MQYNCYCYERTFKLKYVIYFMIDDEPARNDVLNKVFFDRKVGRVDLREEEGANLNNF